MVVKRKAQFFITFAAFLALGIPFMVMVIVEGFTGVRPVNAIPPVAGLLFGPVGALATGLANPIVDLFGTFGWSSLLGVVANFVAAFMPFRLWHLFFDEPPNLHSTKNILGYIGICLISALTVAWFLAFGLYTFFGLWIADIYIMVFFNNFGFSAAFGMPMLILLTSDSIMIRCAKDVPHFFLKRKEPRYFVCAACTTWMLAIFVFVFFLGISPQAAPWMHVLSAFSLAGITVQLI
ncbi:MAG: hypothetical protein FWB91_03210 [Defluviitaleaceae bacterium]|nr:hypothetical protein [Defluviitaleaceae bacterium]